MVKPTQKVANQAPQDSANKLAQYLHDTFWSKNNVLTAEQIRRTKVSPDAVRENTTQRLYVHGEIDGKKAYQTLGYSVRSRKWYFYTVFGAEGGAVIPFIIGISNDNDQEIISALNDSLFMQQLQQTLSER